VYISGASSNSTVGYRDIFKLPLSTNRLWFWRGAIYQIWHNQTSKVNKYLAQYIAHTCVVVGVFVSGSFCSGGTIKQRIWENNLAIQDHIDVQANVKDIKSWAMLHCLPKMAGTWEVRCGRYPSSPSADCNPAAPPLTSGPRDLKPGHTGPPCRYDDKVLVHEEGPWTGTTEAPVTQVCTWCRHCIRMMDKKNTVIFSNKKNMSAYGAYSS